MGIRGQRGLKGQKAQKAVRPRTTGVAKIKSLKPLTARHMVKKLRAELISPKFKGVKPKKHRKPRLLGQIKHHRHPFVNPGAHRGFKRD